MWKLIKITQRPYLMNCLFGDDNSVTFLLYDHKESWIETLTLDELKRKAKLFNRRYDFSEENVRETLIGGDLELATLEQTDTGRAEKIALKLKYRVKNCPFHYECSLQKQTMLEFQTAFVLPLCTSLLDCHEQIEILTDCLKKKDAEILQYRKEGAILNRKTLATKLFNFEEFAKKYETSNKVVADFSELGKFLLNAEPRNERSPAKSIQVKEQESPDKKENSLKKQNKTPWSPGQRKRKIQELKEKHLERNLKTRKQNIVYESSQSQDTNSSSSQSTFLDFEQKKPELKSNTTLTQKIEHKVEGLQSITDTTQKFQQEDKDSKSSSTTTQKLPQKDEETKSSDTTTQKAQKNRQDAKLTSGTAPNAKQKDQDSKSKSSTIIRDQQNDRDSNATDTTTQIILNTSTPIKDKSPCQYTIPEDKEENKSIDIESDSDSDAIILTPRKCTPLRNSKGKTHNVYNADTEADSDDTIKTPRKITRNLSKALPEECVKSLEKFGSNKDNEKKIKNENEQKALRCLAFNDVSTVVEISTDSDSSELTRRYPKRRNTTCTPTKIRGRVTRSSPQSPGVDNVVQRQRRNSVDMSATDLKIFERSSKNKSIRPAAKPIIVGEISSQLSAIRKELESLEALRLADLKQRTCKA